MSKNLKLFVAVKALIINEKREILLLREAASYVDGTNLGKYDVPGGRVDIQESLSDALAREVKEETGLIVLESELIDAHDTFNEKGDEVWHIVRLFYKVKCNKADVVLSQDHSDYEWLTTGEAIKKETLIQNLVPIILKVS